MNKGCYHEILNPTGTYADINGDIGVRSSLLSTKADCFNPSNIGTAIGHPQGIDKSKYITDDMIEDLRCSAVNGLPNHSREISKDIAGEIRGYEDVVGMVQVTQTTTGDVNTLEVDDKLKYEFGDVLQIWDGTNPYRRTVIDVNGTTVTMDENISKVAGDYIIGGGRYPYQTSLATDLIGAP